MSGGSHDLVLTDDATANRVAFEQVLASAAAARCGCRRARTRSTGAWSSDPAGPWPAPSTATDR
ncbi:hypothetical protein [Micromonospora endophytica]|uniref:hypothetical protein n=1 Tax=Micromonospora endophytica TaxID=515350 RepID=UPI002017EE74|nr:hypothetical protein [Micromonospora endophytica]